MEKVYFPVIDSHEHEDKYDKLDVAIKMEHDKIQDKILVELVALQQIMHILGLDKDCENSENITNAPLKSF